MFKNHGAGGLGNRGGGLRSGDMIMRIILNENYKKVKARKRKITKKADGEQITKWANENSLCGSLLTSKSVEATAATI